MDEVCLIWMDTNLINFFDRYYHDVYEAMLAFLCDSTWMSLGVLADVAYMDLPTNSKNMTIPSVMHDLLCHIEDADLGRGL